MKVLYIEDDERLSFVVRTLLTSHGYTVEHFSLGLPGLKCFCKDPQSWDAVLIDLELPDTSGHEIIQKISALQPQLPIVVYSGQSGLKHRFELISTGATALVAKPSSAQDLLDVLKYVIEKPPETVS